MKLTNQEYNFLRDLSAHTKMDCWFSIKTDDDGNDFVLDLENDEALPLHEGIDQLFDGVIEDDINNFNAEELMLWNSLNEKIKQYAAIKEFAEKLKEKFAGIRVLCYNKAEHCLYHRNLEKEIDDLLKEYER